MRIIMGIQVDNRDTDAVKVQELLTKHGCIIKTRLGIHEAASNMCSSSGLILIEFSPNCEEDVKKLESELSTLNDVSVQKMVF